MTSYQYIDPKYFAEPHPYTYTDYEGAGFISSYMESRKRIIQQYPLMADNEMDLYCETRDESFTADYPIATLTVLLAYLSGEGHSAQPIEQLMRRYEVKKVLMHYYDERMIKGITPADMKLYALAHQGFLVAYARTRELPFLNAALKLGDRLISGLSMSVSHEIGAVIAQSLNLEMQSIKELGEIENE